MDKANENYQKILDSKFTKKENIPNRYNRGKK